MLNTDLNLIALNVAAVIYFVAGLVVIGIGILSITRESK